MKRYSVLLQSLAVCCLLYASARADDTEVELVPPPDLPPPMLWQRWFPSHEHPPTDGHDVAHDEGMIQYSGVIEPEEITEEILPGKQNGTNPNPSQFELATASHQEAVLLDDFAMTVEDDEETFASAPLSEPERKQRVRREAVEEEEESSEGEWTPWSTCSVTCGTDGLQTRQKTCFPLKSKPCPNQETEERPCKALFYCPVWGKWARWSRCSKTCGEKGFSFRRRRCIMEKISQTQDELVTVIGRQKDDQNLNKSFSNIQEAKGKGKEERNLESQPEHVPKEVVDPGLCKSNGGHEKQRRRCSLKKTCRVRRNTHSAARRNQHNGAGKQRKSPHKGNKPSPPWKRSQSSNRQNNKQSNKWKWRKPNNNNNNNGQSKQSKPKQSSHNQGVKPKQSTGHQVRQNPQRNGQHPQRSGVKRAPKQMVVRPILSKTRQIKMKSKVMTLPVTTQRHSSQLRNVGGNRYRVSFSKWGPWLSCDAEECGTEGKQMRARSCFGYNFTAEDYRMCSYKNLVSMKNCISPPCPTTKKVVITTQPTSRVSRWSQWSKCSVTCGDGGVQTRRRQCFETISDRIDEIVEIPCTGVTLEERPCQYSVGCPIWNKWSGWSPCSRTCEGDGVSFRERKCVVERYISFRTRCTPSSEEFPFEEELNGNNTRMFDTKSVPMKQVREEANSGNKKSATKVVKDGHKYLPTQRNRGQQTGNVYMTPDDTEVYIVDAPFLMEDEPVPQFHDTRAIKEIVDYELCENLGGASEEEKTCSVTVSCPARWENWGEWSVCSRTCRTGISRRQRKCSGGSAFQTCEGRAFEYRRCYSPACWGEWSPFTACSVSCGPTRGYRSRTRQCLRAPGSAILGAQYHNCDGPTRESQICVEEQCPGSRWMPWTDYGACSESCNGGFRRRTRTCLGGDCVGPSEDFGRCNIQTCPSWTKWSMYSCCSVTCGRGTRKRARTCDGGEPGIAGCEGITEHLEYCYKKPCNGTALPVLYRSSNCGVGSVSNLKRIAHLRIFGGKKSIAHDWPWQVSWQHRAALDEDWQHFCGATLIHPRWVITASHCTEESEYVVNHRNPGEMWSVVIGMDKLYRDGQRHFVDRIFVHPEYEYNSVTKNDIALLKLRRMVPITKQVMPACILKGVKPAYGDKCFITGWGYTSPKEGVSLSLSLREASIPIMSFNDCRNLGQYYRYFLNRTIHMCAGNPVTASSDSCTGDSGGPLVCSRNKRWYLAAVTSFGFADCGTSGHVGIYAPMITFESWVRETIKAFTYEKC